MKSSRFLSLVLLFVAFSCKEGEEPSSEIAGFDFFPLGVGHFTTYDVDSVSITQNVETPYSFQLRVSVVEQFVNGEGNTSFVLQRHTRADDTQPWKAAGTWTAWKTQRQAVVTEGNTSYIKLQFPVSAGLGWNGNALNDLGGDDRCNSSDCDRYEITETDPMVVVTQSNAEDVLTKDVRVEKYSKGIGLVYKESTVYQYCEGGECFGTAFVVEGHRYTMEMKESGNL